jgi:hypothetical protein
MSEIVKFIFDNFNKLTIVDFIIIISFIILFCFGLFFIFRWLFSERFKAQKELISIKDDIINTYKDKIKILDEERELLKIKLTETVEGFEEFNKSLQQKDVVTRQFTKYMISSFKITVLKYEMVILLFSLIDGTRRKLFSYTEMKVQDRINGAPKPKYYDDQLAIIVDHIKDIFNKSPRVNELNDGDFINNINNILPITDADQNKLSEQIDSLNVIMDRVVYQLPEFKLK